MAASASGSDRYRATTIRRARCGRIMTTSPAAGQPVGKDATTSRTIATCATSRNREPYRGRGRWGRDDQRTIRGGSPMHRTIIVLAVLAASALGVVACESDEAKLERLEQEAAVARLSELMYERRLDSIRGVVQQIARDQPNAEGRALGQSILEAYQDSLRSARNRTTLAERELRQFLR